MVELIKNSDDYGLFLLEGDIGGQDWYGDGDQIKDFDQDLATEGLNFLHLPYAGNIKKTPNFNIQILDFFEGAAVDLTLPEGHWIVVATGKYGGTSEADRNTKLGNIENLFMEKLLTSNTPLYLGYRKVGEVWWPFRDDNGATKYYLRGKMLMGEAWRNNFENYIRWKIAFRGIW